jgi:hypothetical protein
MASDDTSSVCISRKDVTPLLEAFFGASVLAQTFFVAPTLARWRNGSV